MFYFLHRTQNYLSSWSCCLDYLLIIYILAYFSHSAHAWGGGSFIYAIDRGLTGRLSRSWGLTMLNPLFGLFGYNSPAEQQNEPKTSSQQVSYDGETTFDYLKIPLTRRQKQISLSIPPQPTTPPPPPPPATTTGEIVLEIGCDPFKYAQSPICQDGEEGYYHIGSSCYFVSSASALLERKKAYTLKEAQAKCESLNDNSGQTLGKWHLLAINDRNEETYVAPLLHTVARGEDGKGELLWVSQMAPVPTVDDAIALDSPFVYTTNCVGAVNIDKTSSHSPEALAELLSNPVGCNILTTRDTDDISGLQPACENTRMAYVCELELDGDRAHFSVSSWQQSTTAPVAAAPLTNNYIELNTIEADLRRPTSVRLHARSNANNMKSLHPVSRKFRGRKLRVKK